METIPLLKKLSETPGITGCETSVRQLISELWRPFVDEVREGGLGSLIGFKRGAGLNPRRKLMLAAHMDEIGLRVSGLVKGFLRVVPVGGVDRRVLPGLEVIVHGRRDLAGVIASRPPHVLPQQERKEALAWDSLFVDVGLSAKEVERLVAVGDLVSFRQELTELQNRRVAAKAMDDRACVAVITLVLEQLGNARHAWDVFAVATVQEEVGLKGAVTAAYHIAPDMGIALDVTFAKSPGVSDVDTYPLDEGPAIGIGPNFHPALVARLKRVAETCEIPFHLDPIPGRSGTDAWAIQAAREGIPTALLSVPLRYMHQPVETLAAPDVERAARLLASLIVSLEPDFEPSWK